MAITALEKPSGFIPVGCGRILYKFQEASLTGKINYRVEVQYNGLFNGARFEYRPDSTGLIEIDIANALFAALTFSENVSNRFKQTFLKLQVRWNTSLGVELSDPIIYLSDDVIYFYLGSNHLLNKRTKFHIDNSLPALNKFLIPTTKAVHQAARTCYVDWLQRVTDALTFTVTGQVVATDGGTLTKTSGAAAYDSQGYSTQSYTQSCYVSFVPNSLLGMAIGLNSDPTLNASYTSLDYCWLLDEVPGAGLKIYESGASVLSVGDVVIPGVTKLSIIYDGVNVNYYKDGILIRSVARAVGAALYLDSSFYTVGAQTTQIEFGPMVNWVSGANFTRDAIRQFSLTGTTDDVYSTESYTTNVYCKASAMESFGGYSAAYGGGLVAFGLDTTPTVGAGYTGIDYCFYIDPGVDWRIYEGGVLRLTVVEPVFVQHIFAIVYDGVNVLYYVDKVLVRSVARAVGAALFFDSYFAASLESILTNMEFGPIPVMNYLNYNNGGDVVLNTQTFKGEKNELYSIGYNGYTVDGTITVKQVGTNTVFATILNFVRSELCNPVFLKWLNDLGGLSTWMFDFNQVASIKAKATNRFKFLTLYAIRALPDEGQMLAELDKDGVVYNDNYRAGAYVTDFTDENNPLPVVVVDAESNVNTNQTSANVIVKIQLPIIKYNI